MSKPVLSNSDKRKISVFYPESLHDKKSTFEMVNAAFKLRDYLDRKTVETKTREVKNDKFAWRDN